MFRRSVVATLGQGVRLFATSSVVRNTSVRAGVLLQRDPIITQQTSGFEAASDRYFEWLHYISAEKFPRDFFFKKGSSAEAKWMELEDMRASEWYFDKSSKPEFKSVKRAVVDEDAEAGDVDEVVSRTIEVQPRETEADKKGDVKSLERKLDRTLYLLVKDSDGKWELPAGTVAEDEVLLDAAKRSLKETCGGRMSVWMVGNGPVGHREAGANTAFFVKGHILAGQAVADGKLAQDFKWATREEVEAAVSSDYWQSVKGMFSSV
ncbi:hypothetical protein LPJ53_002627 [Coemansia erecta]|uniref:Large ribosomal subunit protein mL46 n=1 Tax=Coemansia erecta TaxID=147472 RepID=A0A9W8CRN9_9FUNG|nr:hypothetical protein LPJ53_002627 [Coemansia erecta]